MTSVTCDESSLQLEAVETEAAVPAAADPVDGHGDATQEDAVDPGVGAAGRGIQSGKAWAVRWTHPSWNWALLGAAVEAGVHRVWRSGRSHGKLAAVKDCMRAAFVARVNAKLCLGESVASAKYIWKRLEHVVDVAFKAEEFKKDLNQTQWETFLGRQQVPKKGQPGFNTRDSILQEYCTLLAWAPAGEDDHMFPTDPAILEEAEKATKDLEELLEGYKSMQDLKEGRKAAAEEVAKKSVKKDSDGLALQRYAPS